jgi:hypothetical protein
MSLVFTRMTEHIFVGTEVEEVVDLKITTEAECVLEGVQA